MTRIKVSCDDCGLISKQEDEGGLPDCPNCGGVLRPFDWDAAGKSAPPEAPKPPAPEKTVRSRSRRASSSAKRGAATSEDPLDEMERDDRKRRSEANVELGKAVKVIQRVRAFYVALAVVSLVFLVSLLLVFSEVPAGFGRDVVLVFIGIQSVQVLFLGVGTWQIQKQPYVWSVALAAFVTLTVVLRIALGGFDSSGQILETVTWIVLCLASWAATTMLSKVNVLLQEHGDTPAAQRLRGERPKSGGTSRAASRAAARKSRQGTGGIPAPIYALIGLVVVLGLFVGYVFWKADKQVQQVEDYLAQQQEARQKAEEHAEKIEGLFPAAEERFLAAWGRGDREAITGFLPEAQALRERAFEQLHSTQKRYELPDEFTRILDRRTSIWQDGSEVAKTYYNLEQDDTEPYAMLRLRWHWEEDGWTLVEMFYRKTSDKYKKDG